jgi:hypothetical protein
MSSRTNRARARRGRRRADGRRAGLIAATALAALVTVRLADATASPSAGELGPADRPSALPPAPDGDAPPDPVRFIPGLLSPNTGSLRAVGLGWAGYDGAAHDPVMGALAQARLGSRVILGVSATYAAATATEAAAVRPSVGIQVQLLDQERHGLDAGLGFGFHQDRFVGEEGFLEAIAIAGWRSDQTTLVGNLGYGRDGEGDDSEAAARVAVLRRIHRHFHLGLDGRARKLLVSTDRNRVAHGTPSYEFMAGPLATVVIGPVAVSVEAGVSGVDRQRLQTGLATLGTVGATF